MFLCFYIYNINVFNNQIDSPYVPIMYVAYLLHLTNALYYCDKVVGNYYIKSNLIK